MGVRSDLDELTRLRKENLRLRKALEINQLIAGELNLVPLLRRIMQISRSLMRTESCSLFLYDEGSKELVFYASAGGEESQMKEICRLPEGSGIAGWVAQQRKSVRIADVYADPRFNAEFDRQTGFVTRNMICTPMISHGRLIGVSQVINRHEGDFDEADEQLMESLAQMAAVAIDNATSHQQLLEKQLFRHDMEMARSLQSSFLPQALPKVSGYQSDFQMNSALEVGGDFYDAIPLSDRRIAYLIGDISGKGVAAAMLMSGVLGDIRMELSLAGEACDMLGRINSAICRRSKNGMFVTLLMMILDPESGELEVANAGHLPPLHLRAGRLLACEPASGPPAGIVNDARYASQRLRLLSGDLMLIYTDGITEARNLEDSLLGIERLRHWLAEAPPTVPACRRYLDERIAAFAGTAARSDDITMLLLSRD